MQRQVRIFVILLFLGTSLTAVIGCERRQQAPALPGNPAPAFSLTDAEGSRLTLADFADKVVVLDFWATWCGPCKQAMPEFEELHRAYGNRGVVVIGISVDKGEDARQKVRDYAAKNGVSYRLVVDDGSAYKSYGVVRIPATFVLDRKHVIRDTYPGFQAGIGKQIALDIEKYL